MALAAGDRLGVYEIVSKIGAGGMGEVYRARDTKLDRDVAIKVLPAAVANHPDRLARFEREAKTLAALNHPNIAMIYGLEERAIVMELVEGPTLADRLRAGPLDLNEALGIARQIAEALEAAHEKGIVHRDIKPANVKAPPGAPVKVLDFGLATAMQAPRESSDPVNSPTLTMGATEVGVILGTAAYMSPDQASGKQVDKRADIWSFGVVLWEMLAGKRLFEGGETVSHTLADVLRKEVDFRELPAGIPPAVRTLLQRCLDRDPKTRLRDIGEARVAIERAKAQPEESVAAPAKSRSAVAWAAAVGILALALGGVSLVHFRESPPQRQRVRFQIAYPEGNTLDLKLSPDGRFLAFLVRDSASTAKIWVRALDGLDTRLLTSVSVPTSSLFWSPDGEYVGFDSQNKLYKIARAGGPPVPLCDAPGQFLGGTWRQDGLILFSAAGVLYRVSASGGASTKVDVAGQTGGYPVWIEGDRFLFGVRGGITSWSLGNPKPKPILPGDPSNFVDYVPAAASGFPGHLVFIRGETLMAQRFNGATAELMGEAFPVAEGVGGIGRKFATSASGVLVFGRGSSQSHELVWLDRSGKKLQTVSRPFALMSNPAIRLSPDDTRAIVPVVGDKGPDLWIADLTRGTFSRFTSDGAVAGIWSPDGRKILWTGRDGSRYLRSADGSGTDELLFKQPRAGYPYDWSSRGQIAFTVMGEKTGYDIWMVATEGDRKPQPYLESRFGEYWGQFSPDGRWMAYTSEQPGQAEIVVESIPVGKGRRQISTEGGEWAVWRRDSKELFFSQRNRILAAPIRLTETSVESGKPQLLFEAPNAGLAQARFQVSRDGQRFLFALPVAQDAAAESLIVDTDWRAGLKQ